MVSSTFTDLEEHRAALIKIIEGADLKAVVMENDAAKPDGDVVDSSLNMVRKSAACVGVISHKMVRRPSARCATRSSFRSANWNSMRR